jgi:hypothetical protein
MLGLKSAKVTLDTYADLFDDDLDAVAESLHSRYSPSVRSSKRAQNVLTGLICQSMPNLEIPLSCATDKKALAVAEGFEPSDGFSRHTLSRRAP